MKSESEKIKELRQSLDEFNKAMEHFNNSLSMFLPKKATKIYRKRRNIYGSLIGYARPYYEKMKVGESVSIPPGPWPLRRLRTNIVSDISKRWGPGAHTSTVIDGCIVIKRIRKLRSKHGA